MRLVFIFHGIDNEVKPCFCDIVSVFVANEQHGDVIDCIKF